MEDGESGFNPLKLAFGCSHAHIWMQIRLGDRLILKQRHDFRKGQ